MAHDRHSVSVSRYEDSLNWQMAIQPENRRWVLYVDTLGAPHLYLRTEDRTDESGNVQEVYVYANGPNLSPGRAEQKPGGASALSP